MNTLQYYVSDFNGFECIGDIMKSQLEVAILKF